MNRILGVAAVAAAVIYACSCGGSSSMGGGGGTDAGTCNTANPGDGGVCMNGTDGGPTGASCNTVQNCAPIVQRTQVASAAPAATGGTFVDGTYYLTASIEYTGPGGATGPTGSFHKQTVVLSGGNLAQIVDRADNCGEQKLTISIATSGYNFTGTQTCPACTVNCVNTQPYTSSNGQLTVFEPRGNVTRVETFTKQ